ncbi:hypothetical protein LIS04_01 [Listeria phage LIS04]|nr:hypothetical protein LIS04_01 [Listeria phage LIS04]
MSEILIDIPKDFLSEVTKVLDYHIMKSAAEYEYSDLEIYAKWSSYCLNYEGVIDLELFESIYQRIYELRGTYLEDMREVVSDDSLDNMKLDELLLDLSIQIQRLSDVTTQLNSYILKAYSIKDGSYDSSLQITNHVEPKPKTRRRRRKKSEQSE